MFDLKEIHVYLMLLMLNQDCEVFVGRVNEVLADLCTHIEALW